MIEALNKILSTPQLELARKLSESLSHEQKIWLSGFISGMRQGDVFPDIMMNNGKVPHIQATPLNGTQTNLSILYGSHTGNSKIIANQAQVLAKNMGINADVTDLQKYKSRKFKKEKNVLIIISTHGEGEPPLAAEEFYRYLFGKKALGFGEKNVAVIALGDSSYVEFCKTGKDVYGQLLELGATSIHDLVELDVDFQESVSSVLPRIIRTFAEIEGAKAVEGVDMDDPMPGILLGTAKWVEVEVLEKILLSGRGSEKEIYHIELDIEDSGLRYQAGDALEIASTHNSILVDDILAKLDLDGKTEVEVGKETISIKDALLNKFEITVLTLPIVKKYAAMAEDENLHRLLERPEALNDYLYKADFLDLITDYPAPLDGRRLSGLLRKFPPRLYSISSSYISNPDEVHVTVGAVRYTVNGRVHEGACSAFLADGVQAGDRLRVRVKPNDRFRLPKETRTPIIMVGPGTGIAPFRAFLQEREAAGGEGKNWLFFGDQHFETDFLYQTELLQYRLDGLLHRLDVAFSRDQEEKVYVQHRMREHGARLFQWLEEGAYFYLCGDMTRMAKDVKNELLYIVREHGGGSTTDAEAYIREMRSSGRFQEDVY